MGESYKRGGRCCGRMLQRAQYGGGREGLLQCWDLWLVSAAGARSLQRGLNCSTGLEVTSSQHWLEAAVQGSSGKVRLLKKATTEECCLKSHAETSPVHLCACNTVPTPLFSPTGLLFWESCLILHDHLRSSFNDPQGPGFMTITGIARISVVKLMWLRDTAFYICIT